MLKDGLVKEILITGKNNRMISNESNKKKRKDTKQGIEKLPEAILK